MRAGATRRAAQITASLDRLEPPAPLAEPPDRLYVAMDAAKAHTGGSCTTSSAGWSTPAPACSQRCRCARDAVKVDRSGPKRYCARQEEAAGFGRRVYVADLDQA